jgi:hypothetical protein
MLHCVGPLLVRVCESASVCARAPQAISRKQCCAARAKGNHVMRPASDSFSPLSERRIVAATK